MGFEQIKGMDDFHFVDFSQGVFPGKNRNDVPGAFYTTLSGRAPKSLANGFIEAQHVIWYKGALRKWWGYTVTGAQVGSGANGGGIGGADWTSELSQFAAFGAAFYELAAGTWTDRNPGPIVTMTPDVPYCIKTHIQGANKFVMLGNGTDDMIRWNGAGNNVAALGGSPYKFKSFDYYGERWWGVRNDDNTAYASGTTDPTSNWNANAPIQLPFKGTLVGVQNVNSWLAVVQRDGIGAVEGFGLSSLAKSERIIGVGSPAHLSFAKGEYSANQFGQVENGFYMVGYTGLYFVTESRRLVNLGENRFQDWWNESGNINKAQLSRSLGVWMDQNKLYVCAVPSAANLWPDMLIVIDGKTGAYWPMPSIISTSYNVRGLAVMKDANNVEWLYIQDDNGFVYKFDPTEKNYYPNNTKSGIEAHAKSKVYDLGGLYDLREPQLYAKSVGDWSLTVFFNFDSESGEGDFGNVSLTDGTDPLTTSFTLGLSVLGGKAYVFDDIDVAGQGSLIQYKFKNYDTDESFEVEELVLWMKALRSPSFR